MRSHEINTLTPQRFKKYGAILESYPNQDGSRKWEVVAKVPSDGWCIGMLHLKKDECPYLERHLSTKETLEPVAGTTLLIIALPDDIENTEVFLLDKPVIINEKIWHQLVAISETAVIKVVENVHVPQEASENQYLSGQVNIALTLPEIDTL